MKRGRENAGILKMGFGDIDQRQNVTFALAHCAS